MCKMGMRKVTASVLYNGEKYMIITAESPLGKALMGKKRAMRSSSRPPNSPAMLWSPFRDRVCCGRH